MDASLKAKLDALRRMTTARGCSEAEALAAAEKAAQLMREHGLSEADLEFLAEAVKSRSKGAAVRDQLWSIVATVTNTALIWTDKGDATQIVFVGREPGPQIAAYLHQVLNRAIDGALREYRTTRSWRARRTPKSRRLALDEFTDAMVTRLSFRLLDLFAQTRSSSARLEAVAERNRRFPNFGLVERKELKVERPSAATDAGWKAGGRVNLAHAVHGEAVDRPELGRA